MIERLIGESQSGPMHFSRKIIPSGNIGDVGGDSRIAYRAFRSVVAERCECAVITLVENNMPEGNNGRRK